MGEAFYQGLHLKKSIAYAPRLQGLLLAGLFGWVGLLAGLCIQVEPLGGLPLQVELLAMFHGRVELLVL